jgi:hypothetical protein
MRAVAVLVLAFALTGCMTDEQRVAAQNAKDDQKCLGYGARPGSDAYVTCRSQLDAARTAAAAAEDAAILSSSRQQTPIPKSDAPVLQPMNIPRCAGRYC